MEWYYYLIIFSIILIVFFIFILPFICYKMTFLSKRKKVVSDEITLPDDEMFDEFRDEIIEDIKWARTLPYKKYTINSFDGLKLCAKYYELNPNAPIEIMFHGYKGNGERDLSTGIKRAFKCGRNAFVVDHRASGDSEGKTITFGILERHDCVKWAYFVSNLYPNNKLLITGISMGAATVIMASAMSLPNSVVGVLADCGYDSPKHIIKKVVRDMKLPPNIIYPFIKLGAKLYGRFNIDEISPLEAVKSSRLPIIFIHGSSDDFVPFSMSENMFKNCTSRKKIVLIEGGTHGVAYLKNKEEYIEALTTFFSYVK